MMRHNSYNHQSGGFYPQQGQRGNHNMGMMMHGGGGHHNNHMNMNMNMMQSGNMGGEVHNELEVFVGNLSYYCVEEDLFTLFNGYLPTINARIIRTDNNTRSLMYGFVTFPSMENVLHSIELFNGHLFMGRRMKVEMIDPAKDPALVRAVVQDNAVHISMVSIPTVSEYQIATYSSHIQQFMVHYFTFRTLLC